MPDMPEGHQNWDVARENLARDIERTPRPPFDASITVHSRASDIRLVLANLDYLKACVEECTGGTAEHVAGATKLAFQRDHWKQAYIDGEIRLARLIEELGPLPEPDPEDELIQIKGTDPEGNEHLVVTRCDSDFARALDKVDGDVAVLSRRYLFEMIGQITALFMSNPEPGNEQVMPTEEINAIVADYIGEE